MNSRNGDLGLDTFDEGVVINEGGSDRPGPSRGLLSGQSGLINPDWLHLPSRVFVTHVIHSYFIRRIINTEQSIGLYAALSLEYGRALQYFGMKLLRRTQCLDGSMRLIPMIIN